MNYRKFLLFLLVCFFNLTIFAQIPSLERIEPANWWVGMKNPNLQLVVHGDKVSERSVAIKHDGVTLKNVHKIENPNYLFIDLEISSTAIAGTFPIVFKQKGKKDLEFLYQLKERESNKNRNQGVTDEDFIYLIMPDRFANGDISNDIVKGMRETTLNRDSMYYR